MTEAAMTFRSAVVYAPLTRVTQGKEVEAIDEIVRRAQSGDERAFHELFLRVRADVGRVVYRVLGPNPDIDDVVQDVFVHVYRSLSSFRGESKFSTWLYRLSMNVARMHIRKGRSRPQIAGVEVPDTAIEPEVQLPPDEATDRAERIRALYRLLDELSDKKRSVLVMHDLEGMSAQEIADVVDAPVLTVRTRLFYARKELYAALEKEPSLRGMLRELVNATERALAPRESADKSERGARTAGERTQSGSIEHDVKSVDDRSEVPT